LMRHALAYLEARGVTCIRLDATPLGRPIYEKLGFVADYPLARFEGIPETLPAVPGVSALDRDQLDSLFRFDRTAVGADRGKLLSALFTEHAEAWRAVDGPNSPGFLFSRAGSRAVQIGPCLADGETGPMLLQDAWRRHAGKKVFIDVPLGN